MTSFDKFTIDKICGKGGQGTVYKAYHKDNNKCVAIKKVLCEDFDAANKAMREMFTIQKLKHINLVEYTELFLDVDQDTGNVSVCIVMPFYEDGDLDAVIASFYDKNQIVPKELILSFALQIASCLEFLHENKLMHRDLKPENIFVEKDKDGKYTLKLGDFGVAKEIFGKNLSKTVVGTPAYMAPEIIIRQEHDEKVDLFSFGAMLYKLMTNKERQMWSELTENTEKTLQTIEQEIKKNYPDELYNLTINLLSIEPTKRLSAKQVVSALTKISSKELSSESFILLFPVDDLTRIYGTKFVHLLERIFINDSTLTEVNVTSYGGEHELGKEGAEYLAKALERNTVIKSINLERTKIGPEGLKYLGDYIAANKTIISVKLSNNGIGDDGVRIVSEAFYKNFSISFLDLSHNNITEEGAKYLGKSLLQNHETAKTKVDWKYMVQRKTFGINFLNLSGNNLTKEAAEPIFKSLSSIETLEEFNFSGNKLGEEGVICLGKYLSQNKSIYNLNLSENDIGPKGLKELCNAIMAQFHLKTKKELNLNNLDEDEEDLEPPPNEYLTLRKNKLGVWAKGDNAKYPEGMIALRDLLKSNPCLIYLDLQSNSISSKDLKILGEGLKKSKLTHLDFSKNDLRDEGAKYLAEFVKVSTTIRNLLLKDNKIGHKGISVLCQGLEKNTTLVELDLAFNKFGNEGCEPISKIINTQIVTKSLFGLVTVTPGKEHILETIHLQGNEIGDDGLIELCKGLKLNTTLKYLNLQGNRLGERGIEELSKILAKNTTMTFLDLSGGEQEEISNEFKDDGVMSLSSALKSNTSLLHLFLARNKIGNEGAEYLAQVLPSSSLINLDLSFNDIGNDGAKSLSERLEKNKSLKRLLIKENPIKSELKIQFKTKEPRMIFSDKENGTN